jgi:hypothetical protein
MSGLVMLAGVRKQASNYVADRRADTQRNIKDSDELECRQWRPPVSAARHSSFMKKEVVLPHQIKVPRLTVNVTCAWRHHPADTLPRCFLLAVVTATSARGLSQSSSVSRDYRSAIVASNPHQFSGMTRT